MRQFFYVLALAVPIALQPSPARATSIFLDIPGITGESPVPGHPGAIEVQSITINSAGFAIVKPVDRASPQLLTAVSLGTFFLNASVLLYNAAPTGPPDVTLSFQQVLATSIHQVNGTTPSEAVSFAFASGPISMFLELPGITGESSTPGHPGVMELQSFALDGQQGFSVVRPVDKATPELLNAVAQGSFFSSARILFYDSTPADAPLATILFQQTLAVSLHLDSGVIPTETDGFVFTSVASGPIDVSTFTPTGAPVTVQPTDASGDVQPITVTFAVVSTAGRTAATPVSAPALPAGYQLNGVVYDISTTATYTAPVTVCFLGTFSTASQVLHYVNGTWVVLPGRKLQPVGRPAYNKICARTTTLSPFAVGNRLRSDERDRDDDRDGRETESREDAERR